MERTHLNLLVAVLVCAALTACSGGSSQHSDVMASDATADGVTDTTNDGSDAQAETDPGDGADGNATTVRCVGGDDNLIPFACTAQQYCHSSGYCYWRLSVGQQCDGPLAPHTKESPDRVCQQGYCKDGPFSGKFCTNLQETCGNSTIAVSQGQVVCSSDRKQSRRCGDDANWETVIPCENTVCNNGLGNFVSLCEAGKGCKTETACTSCAPGRFSATLKACSVACAYDNECAPAASCDGGTCAVNGKKANGKPCSANGDCISGLCVKALNDGGTLNYPQDGADPDKICCAKDCGANCVACAKDGLSCGNVASGQRDKSCMVVDPRGGGNFVKCGTNGKCDGSGNCSRWPSGTPCTDTSCSCENGTCKQTQPGTCDLQHNCNPSNNTIPCPQNTCKPDNLTCDFGECDKQTPCVSDFTYCSGTKNPPPSETYQCHVKHELYQQCDNLTVNADVDPFDNQACLSSLACLKHNFNGGQTGLCGSPSACIGPEGLTQKLVGSVRCISEASGKTCTLISGKPEWVADVTCDPTPKGCEKVPGQPNSGIQQNSQCTPYDGSGIVEGKGCIAGSCAFCEKRTRFDANSAACIPSCQGDTDCISGHRCHVASGTCVEVVLLGQVCNGNQNGSVDDFVPCGKSGETQLSCTRGFSGMDICCFNDCPGGCKDCDDVGPDSPTYDCVNRSASYQAAECNQTNGTTCGAQTGLCDGGGACALPGNGVQCASSCSAAQVTLTYCDAQGNCNLSGQPQQCPGGKTCKDTQVCEDATCESHDQCTNGYFCNAQKICQLRLAEHSACHAKTYQSGTVPFDDAACQSSLFCRKTPSSDAGYCTVANKCRVNASTTIAPETFHCSAEAKKAYKCKSDGSWESSDCDQSTNTPCENDSKGKPKGYKNPATCDANQGCQVDSTCHLCSDNLLYTSTPQPGSTKPCFRFCHCIPGDNLGQPSACEPGWIYEIHDDHCADDRWCGTDPIDPGSPNSCRDRLELTNKCSDVDADTAKPSRQCKDPGHCCGEILAVDDQGGITRGTPYCASCCDDKECKDTKYCDVKLGGCQDQKQLGVACTRSGECADGKTCCNSICSECCGDGDCATPEKPYCIDGQCADKKNGGTPCSTGVECKSGTCHPTKFICTCEQAAHCSDNQYCDDPNDQCYDKKAPGAQCAPGNGFECLSDTCCGDGRCKGDCCTEGDCKDPAKPWCDNAGKTSLLQPLDGKTYICKAPRQAFQGCASDLQCKRGCRTDAGFCSQCKGDEDCRNGQLLQQCCFGICVTTGGVVVEETIGVDPPISLCPQCTAGLLTCGNECCTASQYCQAGKCANKKSPPGSCSQNDQWCDTTKCDRTENLCIY